MDPSNWLELHDLFTAQINERFPIGDIRPFAAQLRDCKNWGQVEQLLRDDEERSRPRVQRAILQFIEHRGWPNDLNDREKMWISGHLRLAQDITLKLLLPITDFGVTVQTPPGIPLADVMKWLLLEQWDGYGLNQWVGDLRILHSPQQAPENSKTPEPRRRLPSSDGDLEFPA